MAKNISVVLRALFLLCAMAGLQACFHHEAEEHSVSVAPADVSVGHEEHSVEVPGVAVQHEEHKAVIP
jgi:hypothetical protein